MRGAARRARRRPGDADAGFQRGGGGGRGGRPGRDARVPGRGRRSAGGRADRRAGRAAYAAAPALARGQPPARLRGRGTARRAPVRPAGAPRHQVAAGAVTPVGLHDGGHGRAAAGTGTHLQADADEFGAFGHAPQSVRPSEAPGQGGPRRRSRSRRRHAQERVPAVAGQLDLHPAGLRVLDNVLQRFPGGAVQRDLRVLGTGIRQRPPRYRAARSNGPGWSAHRPGPGRRGREAAGRRWPSSSRARSASSWPIQFATAASLPVAARLPHRVIGQTVLVWPGGGPVYFLHPARLFRLQTGVQQVGEQVQRLGPPAAHLIQRHRTGPRLPVPASPVPVRRRCCTKP